jgi:hypothetical protein
MRMFEVTSVAPYCIMVYIQTIANRIGTESQT